MSKSKERTYRKGIKDLYLKLRKPGVVFSSVDLSLLCWYSQQLIKIKYKMNKN